MTASAHNANTGYRTLTIDIGGTGIKALPINDEGKPLAERSRLLTPKPSTPVRVLEIIKQMIDAQEPFARVSVGFPGVVTRGVVKTGPNLGTEAWRGFDLQSAIAEYSGKPVRVINDADLQGYGVIEGEGVEIVLTLGTGLGTGLYVNGHLVSNLELAHHPLMKNKTYEDLVSDAERKRVGNKGWRKEVEWVFETIYSLFHYDLMHVGGGNARHLRGPFPGNVRLFENVEGMTGGIRLWEDDPT